MHSCISVILDIEETLHSNLSLPSIIFLLIVFLMKQIQQSEWTLDLVTLTVFLILLELLSQVIILLLQNS